MYDEWTDVDLTWGDSSVLDRLIPSTSRTVTIAVVDDLARQLTAQSCSLTTDSEVRWCMQVLCYGLGLPFSADYSTVRNVVNLYCEWLSCLNNEPPTSVPRPLVEQPSKYARDIINHLHHLFVPRAETGSEVIIRQAKECHRVLRCLQSILTYCKADVKNEIWPEILRFLLSVNESLLSPPYEQDDISDQLCTRTLSVLFELWITACFTGHFPTPPFWKTFRSLCHNWRHRIPLVDQWAHACFLLTALQLQCLYGPNYSKIKLAPEDQKLIPHNVQSTLITQTWFRMMTLIGNPADILNVHNFDSSVKFREYIGSHAGETGIMDPVDHPCLLHLPFCFFRAVSCINLLISAFLGEPTDCTFRAPERFNDLGDLCTTQMSPQGLGPGAQQAVALSTVSRRAVGLPNVGRTKESRSQSVCVAKPSQHVSDSLLVATAFKSSPAKYRLNVVYPPEKPSVDSLLRLFGDWLFSCMVAKAADKKKLHQEDSLSQKSMGSHSTEHAETMSKSSSQSELMRGGGFDIASGVSGVQAGKAEAVAALCKIFCSKTFTEKIGDNQVAKFCAVLLDVLSRDDYVVQAAVIYYGVNIFRVNLRGVELLVPYFLDCLDHVTTEPDKLRVHPSISDVELRRSCLDVLSSIVFYPTHFGTSAFSDVNRNTEQHTFIGFRVRILRILLNSLKLETDSNNIQLSLGLISLFYESCLLWERSAGSLQNMNYIKEMLRTILSLVAELLCGKWSSEHGVCLSALDCLNVFSHVEEEDQTNKDEVAVFDKVILAVCRFIELQLSRPPPAHSRDLHSTVVAAYYCLETWIVAFQSIIRNEQCLKIITETIQLGITGAKARSKEENEADSKKPASQRVHDAAEQLLHTMFCRAGAPFTMCEPIEDENYLLKCLGSPSTLDQAILPRFTYALLDNTCIFGVTEVEILSDDKNDIPAVAVVIRTPYASTTTWLFKVETQPKQTAVIATEKNSPTEVAVKPTIKYPRPVYMPPDVEKFGRCRVDNSIPLLRLSPEAESIKTYIEEIGRQQQWVNWKADPQFARLDAKPPSRETVVNTARLLFHDLGYLDHNVVAERFRLLDTKNANFIADLQSVDRCSARFIHTAHIFYVESGRVSTVDILKNAAQIENTSMAFRKFLTTLGVCVEVGKDQVWTGSWRTAYATSSSVPSAPDSNKTIDGVSRSLYWASPLVEIAFIMPNLNVTKSDDSSSAGVSSTGGETAGTKPSEPLVLSPVTFHLSQNTVSAPFRWRARSFDDLDLDIEEDDETEENPEANVQPKPCPKTLTLSEPGNETVALSATSQTSAACALVSPTSSPTLRRKSTKFRKFLFGRKKSASVYHSNSQTSHLHAAHAQGASMDPGARSSHGLPPPPPPPPRSKSVSCNDVDIAKLNVMMGTKKIRSSVYQDYRFFIVWLERFEDHVSFPSDDLLAFTDLGESGQSADNQKYVLFICPFGNGLFRIKLAAQQWSKLGYPSPLVDGVVVSEDVLSLSVRQTLLSIGARRRLEQEGYLPPFVKRRQKIHEFAGKYDMEMSASETFYSILMR